MRNDTEVLFEHVLAAVMRTESSPLTLATTLKGSVPEARVTALIRALLAAEQAIRETFNGSATARDDADLARRFAVILAEHADDLEHDRQVGLRLRDLPI